MAFMKSFVEYELSFPSPIPEGKKRPGPPIVLPKHLYPKSQHAAGATNVCSVTDEQLAHLKSLSMFNYLLAKGKAGGFVLVDRLPQSAKPLKVRLAEAEAENAALKAQLESKAGGE